MRFVIERPDFELDVDLSIPARGITGVFGRSGAGKTTLLRSIAGLEAPRYGRLVVGKDTWLDTDSNFSKPVRDRAVGYVFQEPRLFGHLDVRGNIDYGRRRAGRRGQRLDVEQIVGMLAIGGLLERRTSELSGGEAQRVAIARALMTAPSLVLMDEPLSSIDEDRKDEILPFLERLHRELPVPAIYVSHNVDEISRLCDHLVVIDQGRVVASGELQAVLTGMDLPVLSGREACSVIEAQIASVDAGYELTSASFKGGELMLPGLLGEPGQALRVRIRASDISLCKKMPQQTSILNVLPARVDDISLEDGPTVLLRLVLGDDRLLARITRRSLRTLDLKDGDDVFAQIKSVTVRS
jgi:molybdate transport system ATP-binding protein